MTDLKVLPASANHSLSLLSASKQALLSDTAMASSRQVLIGFVLVFCWMACVLGRAQGMINNHASRNKHLLEQAYAAQDCAEFGVWVCVGGAHRESSELRCCALATAWPWRIPVKLSFAIISVPSLEAWQMTCGFGQPWLARPAVNINASQGPCADPESLTANFSFACAGAAVQEQSVGSRRELLASCGAESGCSTCSTPVSYLDSCNTPSFSGCQICAACAAPNGDKTYSCVDTSNGCNSIDNILGYLKCQ